MVTPKSHEYLLGTPEGVKKARTVRRMRPSERWDPEAIENFKGEP